MQPFVEAMMDGAWADTQPIFRHEWIEKFLKDRDMRFKEGNDRAWGEGNWIRCHTCLDGFGYPSYHHKDVHQGD